MTFDLEKARAETEHLRENIEEEFSCMCGVCHVCGFNPEEMEEALAEIERLRADNAGLSKAVIDIQEERDLVQAEFRTYHKAWKEQATRIQELEDALVEERANANRSGTGNILMSYLRDNNIDPEKYFSEKATEQLQAEGKIGPNADAKPRVWQITEERKDALQDAVDRYDVVDRCLVIHKRKMQNVTVLRGMLQEAGQ